MPNRPLGTANILHQHTEYEKLKEEYSPDVANQLTAKSLVRYGVDATPNDVSAWNKINNAAIDGKMDPAGEHQAAKSRADLAAIDMIEAIKASTKPQDADAPWLADAPEDEESEEDAHAPDDELPSIDEMYGCENSDDNDEAALDDVLKAQERVD